ncbi:monovalent cation/H+ antiporter subunit D family protein [Kiloniella sp.]|uniref:monovalent cation/H+ antiporter subunit D family protein n=1 Tax=Kiloniella sp. TaxID=1938587 RepID=UPI003B011F8F
MENEYSIRPLLAIIVALMAAGAILVFRHHSKWRDAVSLVASVIMFLIVISMAPKVMAGGTFELNLFTVLPGVDFAFRVDSLGMVFATISSLLWIVAAIYCIGYMRSLKEQNQTRFYISFAISLAAAIGGAFSANLFTLVIFYEVLSLITYPLVYHKETDKSWHGSRRYLVYLMGASKTFLLAGLALTYQVAGTLDFKPNGLFDNLDLSGALLTGIYLCYLAGFAKAAIMPFHAWLPAAMVAPTPVSALLHAVAVVKMGVFCVLRLVFDVVGLRLMDLHSLGIGTAYLVSFTIIMASIYALTRDDLKARLAYSTVSQLSYIILGAVMLSPLSIIGGVMHMPGHALSKITLFFCAGSIYCASKRMKISELAGIGRHLPWTMTGFFIGSLGMIGVPSTGGFISKWYLVLGSVEAGELFFLLVLLASSVLNAAYFLPISYIAFFREETLGQVAPTAEGEIREIPLVTVPLVATALLSMVMGIYPDYFLTLARGVVP